MDIAKYKALLEGSSNNDTLIGGSVEVGPGERKTVLQLGGDDDVASVVSIVIGTPDITKIDFTLDQHVNPTAIIEFGTGGVQSKIEVDCQHGCALQIPCSFLKIDIKNNSPAGAGKLTGSAFAGYFPLPRLTSPSHSVDGIANPGDVNVFFVAPAYARQVQVLELVGNPFTISFVEKNFGKFGAIIQPANTPPLILQLPSGFEGIFISDDVAGLGLHLRVTWFLEF